MRIILFIIWSSFSWASSSPQIDLSLPAPTPSEGFQSLFDQSQLNQPGFVIYERDTRLSDLFSSDGKSQLCFPSAFAEGLVMRFRANPSLYGSLKLEGLSADQKTIDPSLLVRALANQCKTDRDSGTDPINEFSCISNRLRDAGFEHSDIQIVTNRNRNYPIEASVQHHTPSVDEIRHFVDSGYTVILGIGWWELDPSTKQWKRNSGHAVSIVGYGYNRSWSDSQIVLKIANPNLFYDQTQKFALGDSVTMTKIVKKPGMNYPSEADMTLIGNGFAAVNFVETLTAYLPN